MAGEDSSAAEKSDLISYAKYGERVLALCGVLAHCGIDGLLRWSGGHEGVAGIPSGQS